MSEEKIKDNVIPFPKQTRHRVLVSQGEAIVLFDAKDPTRVGKTYKAKMFEETHIKYP